jgi:hypothetical protein
MKNLLLTPVTLTVFTMIVALANAQQVHDSDPDTIPGRRTGYPSGNTLHSFPRDYIGNRDVGNVGIGTTDPPAKLSILGPIGNPTIPGYSSTGILRIGVGDNEGIDIGKLGSTPFSGWIQAGYDGTVADPLSLQPIGGNVGIGTTSPTAKLHVSGGDALINGLTVGKSTSTGAENTAFGDHALYNNNSSGNTAIGYYTLYLNISGNNNTALGDRALYSDSTGSYNTAIGFQSMYTNKS